MKPFGVFFDRSKHHLTPFFENRFFYLLLVATAGRRVLQGVGIENKNDQSQHLRPSTHSRIITFFVA